MVEVEIYQTTFRMPGAGEFDLLIKEAESLINSSGTVSFKRGAVVDTVTGADATAYRVYTNIIEEAPKWREAFRRVGTAVRAGWRFTVWGVVGVAAEWTIGRIFDDIGIGRALEAMTQAAAQPEGGNADPETRVRFRCVWNRNRHTRPICLADIEARRMDAGRSWEKERRRIASMPWVSPIDRGILKVYEGMAESLLASIAAAYVQTQLERSSRSRTRKKAVRALSPVRGVGRPRKGGGLEPRTRGKWSKKHPEPQK